jgi:hypothetical protein
MLNKKYVRAGAMTLVLGLFLGLFLNAVTVDPAWAQAAPAAEAPAAAAPEAPKLDSGDRRGCSPRPRSC